MYILYVDESGVPERCPDSSHFVLIGLSIPLSSWKERDSQVRAVLAASRLPGAELHSAWMARKYPEQERIPDFRAASDEDRRRLVAIERRKDIAKASLRSDAAVRSLRRNYKQTEQYVHLTREERVRALQSVADVVSSWESARLFGDAHNKSAFAGGFLGNSREMALEQVTTRFHTFLVKTAGSDSMGVVVHDQHQAESLKLTTIFRDWHERGTRFSKIPRIAETPLFVDSSLTLMVQVSDLVAFATRRFFEHGSTDLFDRVYERFDRTPDGKLVGLRHYTAKKSCSCRVCTDHGRPAGG